MCKKALSIMLALVMILCLMPMTALAAGSISLDKTTYAPGERIRVTSTGITQQMVDDDAFVSIYDAGASHDSWQEYKYLTNVGSNTSDLTAPKKNGNYEMRLYSMNGYYSDATMVMKVSFTVGTGSSQSVPGPASISLDKTTYAAGERIRVTSTGITQQMVDDDAFVSIYDVGASHDSWQEYKYLTNVGSNTSDLTAPKKNGNYEMRLYSMNGYYSDATMVMKVAFTVGNATPAVTEPTTPTPTPTTPTAPAGSLTAAAVSSGVKLEWPAIAGSLGYRIYRSTTAGVEGISITDFAITSTSCVDVNVDANTTYYYTLRALLKEANAATGERETLGSPSAQDSVKTGAEILGGNASDMGSATKNVILMKLNDPNMSVNGLKQEIDPGRGTTPQTMNGRTIVPIRAIIETMGGTVGWDDYASKITLSANGHSVTMWLNKKDLVVDGANKTMDVALVAINDRTMVPVRFAAENVGCVVDWIGSTSEIVIVYYSGGTPALRA